MTLVDLANYVCGKVGQSDAVTVSLVKGFIRARYQMIYDAALWRDSLIVISGIAAASDVVTLDSRIDRIVGVRYGDHEAIATDLSTLIQVDPNIFERTGTPLRFSELTPVACGIAPASEFVRVASDNVADVSLSVLLRGELAGVEQTETIALNGLTPSVSAKAYDTLYTLSKPTTTGTVTAMGVTSAATLVTLWPEENERKFARLRLHERPSDTTQTLLVLGKRKLRPLTNDLDTPVIRSIDNALVAYAMSDLLERLRQFSKAQSKVQEASELMKAVRELEKNQNANMTRIAPAADVAYENDWSSETAWLK